RRRHHRRGRVREAGRARLESLTAHPITARSVAGLLTRSGRQRDPPARRCTKGQGPAGEEGANYGDESHILCVYVGLAGETAPGRPVKSGLYRMAVGDDRWELLTRGLPSGPLPRTLSTARPCATSGGEVFGSDDGGQSWAERHLPDGATQVYAMGCA